MTWPDGMQANIRLDPADIFSKPLLTYFLARRFLRPFRNPITRKVLRRRGADQETAKTDFESFKSYDLTQFNGKIVKAKGLSLAVDFISADDSFSIQENIFSVEAVNTPYPNQEFRRREFRSLFGIDFTAAPPLRCVPARPHKNTGRAKPIIVFSERATSLLLENYFIPNLMRANILNGVSCFKSLEDAASCSNKGEVRIRLADDFINDLGVNDTASEDGSFVVTGEGISGLVDSFDTGIDRELGSLFRDLVPKLEVFSESAVELPELNRAASVYHLDHITGVTTNYDWRGGCEFTVAGRTANDTIKIKIKDCAADILTARRFGVWKEPGTLRAGLYYKHGGS